MSTVVATSNQYHAKGIAQCVSRAQGCAAGYAQNHTMAEPKPTFYALLFGCRSVAEPLKSAAAKAWLGLCKAAGGPL